MAESLDALCVPHRARPDHLDFRHLAWVLAKIIEPQTLDRKNLSRRSCDRDDLLLGQDIANRLVLCLHQSSRQILSDALYSEKSIRPDFGMGDALRKFDGMGGVKPQRRNRPTMAATRLVVLHASIQF